MWQVLANCRTWNQELFHELMVQFQLEKWQSLFAKITASQYVEEVDVNKDGINTNFELWRLHPLMRQHLQENQPQDLRRLVNSWLFEYYQREYQTSKSQVSELTLNSLAEAVFHALESSQSETAVNWCLEEISAQQQQGKHQAIIPTLEYLQEYLSQNPVFTNNGQWLALSATLLGKSLKVLGDNNQAIATLENARSHWQSLGLAESLDAATVELELAGMYHRMGQTFDADKASDRALSIRTKLLGENSPAVAEALNSQAEIAASQGYYRQAVNYCDRALKILQSHPDTQPLQLAQLKFTAAWLNGYQNNLDAAEKLLQEALEIVINTAGNEHPLAISCQASLGDVYQQMGTHRYQKAYEQYSLALDAAETHLGISHFQTLQLLKALASFCRKRGEYDAADEFAQRHNDNVAIGGWEETADAATRLNNIGYSLQEKGEYGKAEPLYKQALQMRLKVLGKEHPDTAQSLNNLAALYYFQGRYDEAEPLYNRALQIRLKVLGQEHPDTASSFNNLAWLYKSQGTYDEAEPLFKQALQICLKVLGQKHPDTAITLNNLAGLYNSQGRYDEAESLYNQALQIRLKVLGQEHPDTANSLNNLAGLYESQGKYDKAEPLYNQALQIRLKVLGQEHPDTATSLNNLAWFYTSQGRYDEAEPLLKQALQIWLKVLGQEHPHTGASLNNLARLYKSQGKYDEAEPLYNQALQIRLKVLGQEHPDTATSLNNLALLYKSQGRYDEAEPLYNQALQICLKVLGQEHPHTKNVENNLSDLHQKMSAENSPS
jgi:tetratricopeptide (TPR) repeat protein